MSLEVWGDDGCTDHDEPSFIAGQQSMAENVADAIDEQKRILKADLSETNKMLAEKKTAELWEAYTRLNQAINAFSEVEKVLKRITPMIISGATAERG